jgi:hypothetical protein
MSATTATTADFLFACILSVIFTAWQQSTQFAQLWILCERGLRLDPP